MSHIVPSFVFDWVKRTAPGAIRLARSPSRRVQDGAKLQLLCDACEQRFGIWEKAFSENIFAPLHSNPEGSLLEYGEWGLKLAVSVSWRVLTYFETLGVQHLSAAHQTAAQRALGVWREFLLEERPNPGRFEQHVFLLDVIRDVTTHDLSPFINRYLVRAIDIDLPCSKVSAIVYVKMCKLLLIGFVDVQKQHDWKGGKLNVKRGEIRPGRYSMPGNMFGYLNSRAALVARSLSQLSPRQNQKIEERFRARAEQVPDSEIFRATTYDVARFGSAAFEITEAGPSDETEALPNQGIQPTRKKMRAADA